MKLAGGRIMPDKVKNRKTMEPLGKMVFYGPGLMYNPIMAYFSELLLIEIPSPIMVKKPAS
jgi:hypothetical protein